MKVTFQCPTCGGVVEYEQHSVEPTKYRMYAVPTYTCVSPCKTCEAAKVSVGG